MEKSKLIFNWVMFVGWLAIGLYALFTKEESHWREMFAVACLLLAIENAFDR
jgi:hypothetical protein